MDAKNVISDILKDKSEIQQVYWVACGGSLIDLYPAHFMLLHDSAKIETHCYTSREFLLVPPKKLCKNSLMIACSHSGNTPEAVEAALKASDAGAAVIALTDNKGSRMDDRRFISWVYPWGDGIAAAEVPSGITLLLAAELIFQQEGGYSKYDAIIDGIGKMDNILTAAREKVNSGISRQFAELCGKHPFFYILGSGAAFSQTYGMAICSMMEMQRQNCCYIHSGEYFHGPFEVTENGVFYFLQMGSGVCREMDERALVFLKNHTDQLMVLDALEFGMSAIDPSVRDYMDSILFYAMNVELRAERGKKFNHPPATRRYMGVEKY